MGNLLVAVTEIAIIVLKEWLDGKTAKDETEVPESEPR